jgi:hypothetical protein
VIVSDFEVGRLSAVESDALSSLWESNGSLPEDWISELRQAGSERPFSAFAYFGYLVEVNPDPRLYLEAIEMLRRHRISPEPSIAAAASLAASMLKDWATDAGVSLPTGWDSLSWLKQSTTLRPDWVKNWIELYRHQLSVGNWAAAVVSAEQSARNVGQVSPGSDSVTNAFEWLFTGRFGWSKDQAAELADRARKFA